MSRYARGCSKTRILAKVALPVLGVLLIGPPTMRAQEHVDFDQYKLRLEGSWFYSNPSGTIEGQAENAPIDVQRDIGFTSYSTFFTKADWKFTRKNHLYVTLGRFDSAHQKVLERTITFQGTTFEAGLQTQSELNVFFAAPGYQYDIIRRKRGHLGLGLQFNLMNTSAKISAQAQVTGGEGSQAAARSASGSLFAPLPVAGPQYRFYLTNSPRLFIDGDLYGMYFFGYGNFLSTANRVGVSFNRHISATAGYQLASRLVVTPKADRIGMHLTQKGAIVGVQFSF